MANADITQPMNLLQTDVDAIKDRLEQVLLSLKSIQALTEELHDPSDNQSWYAVAISEMARANIKGVDACMGRLIGQNCAFGNYLTEFDRD